jgi:glyoxylase-like metal-dependent hydrolase (beta-lactamase superfamily II)
MKIECFVADPFQENTYVVSNGNSCVIVDPGGREDDIDTWMRDNELAPVAVLLTHGHIDHVMALGHFTDTYQVPVYVSKHEVPVLEHLELQARMFGLPVPSLPETFTFYDGESDVEIESFRFSLIETPGHSPGSLCLYTDTFMLTGDTLFAGSIGRTDLPGGSLEQIARSIRKLYGACKNDLQIFPGHGPASTLWREKQLNPFVTEFLQNEDSV